MEPVERTNIMAVMDGHGENGAEASSFLQTEFPTMLTTILSSHLNGSSNANFLKIISKEFTRLDQKLVGPKFMNSGSTATVCVHADDLLLVAAVGDSRAVLGSLGPTPGAYTSTLLSFDHKADRPEEQARLVNRGAEVRPIYSNGRPFGPARLFKKGEEYPGLAVSRAFGDRLSKDIGVVAEPEIAIHTLVPEDRCIVLASDGVWDQVTNEEAVRIAMSCYQDDAPQSAAIALCKEARRRWERGLKTAGGESTGNIDDITSVIGFLRAPAQAAQADVSASGAEISNGDARAAEEGASRTGHADRKSVV